MQLSQNTILAMEILLILVNLLKKTNIKYIETSIKDFTKHIDQCSFTWNEIKKILKKEISEKYLEWIFYPASEFKHLTTQKLDKILDDIVWPEAR